MKDERKIIIKNERLKRIRNGLRRIIILATYNEIEVLRNFSSLYGGIDSLTPIEESEVYYLEGTKNELYSALRKSICSCPLCTNQDRDMVYIELHNAWYCTKCQDERRIWYPVMGSEEDRRQHDYINWYYTQKEKFSKKYQNNRKEFLDK